MEDTELPVLIYTTFASLDDAQTVGGALVDARLAACVNVFPGMVSIYQWEGVRETADEVAMIVKTRAGLKDEVIAEVERLPPYDVPALLVLPTQGGNADYCAWIVEETQVATQGGRA